MRSRRLRTGAAAGMTSPHSVSGTSSGGPGSAVLGTGPHGQVSIMAGVDDVDRSCVRLTTNRGTLDMAFAKGLRSGITREEDFGGKILDAWRICPSLSPPR